jgi:hypothetical protein
MQCESGSPHNSWQYIKIIRQYNTSQNPPAGYSYHCFYVVELPTYEIDN